MTEIKFEEKTKTAICFILMSVTWIIRQKVFWIENTTIQGSLLELPHQYQRFRVLLLESRGKDDLKYPAEVGVLCS